MGVLEIFVGCTEDICWVSRRYLIHIPEILIGVPEIFDVCP